MKAKRKVSEPLKRVRFAQTLTLLCVFAAMALFGGAIWFFRLREYREGWAMVAVTVVVVLCLLIPAARGYRSRWKQQSVIAGYGMYAEETELDENPHMAPEQFELLCLFPFDLGAIHDFDVHREIRLVCRERTVRIRELTVPARIRGLEALVDGCLIQMNMPRSLVSRVILAGASFGDQDILTAWYRKNLRLLPAMYSVQKRMQTYTDGSELSMRSIEQLRRITEKRGRDMVLSLSGRELNIFIRNADLLTRAPSVFQRVKQSRLQRLSIPELPAILDFAFDTESLRAGVVVPYDEDEDRKYAGLQYVQPENDEAFRRPEDNA